MKFTSAIILATALLAPANVVEASNDLNPHHCTNIGSEADDPKKRDGKTQVCRVCEKNCILFMSMCISAQTKQTNQTHSTSTYLNHHISQQYYL